MSKIAEIIINSTVKSLNKVFDYIIPEAFADIEIGTRVYVPFGNKERLEEGYVIAKKDVSSFAKKEIDSIQKGYPLSKANIVLAEQMSKLYFCNMSDCIKLMLQPGTKGNEKTRIKGRKKAKDLFAEKEINRDQNLSFTEEQQIVFEKICEHITAEEFSESLVFRCNRVSAKQKSIYS